MYIVHGEYKLALLNNRLDLRGNVVLGQLFICELRKKEAFVRNHKGVK